MDFEKAYNLITEKLTKWGEQTVKLLPNLILAVVILVIGFFLVKLIKKYIDKGIEKIIHNPTLANFFSSIINFVLLGVVVFTALNVLQLDKTVTTVLAGAGILGLALAFAFQDIAANFMSGIFLSIRRPIHVGDTVQIGSYMGKIAEINLRDTVLQTFQGQMVIIPNKDVFQNPIENYSILGKRRVDLSVGVSYGDDLEKVKKVTMDAVSKVPNLHPDQAPTFYYSEFADSSINFTLRLWINVAENTDFLQVRSDAIIAIKKAFDDANIMIPFPIRTLDFGVKGGVALDELNLNATNNEVAQVPVADENV